VPGAPGAAPAAACAATPEAPLTVYQYVPLAMPRDSAPLPRATHVATAAADRGYASLRADHVAAWHTLWETDVVVQDDPELQRLVHSMLFALLASAREGSDASIPPMGLSSAGYYGHVFWDADTWMFPPLVLLHP